MSAGEDRLDSWKEIATFIGKDERTAARWARERGLPVHRVPGGKRGGVFAYRSEIAKWLAGHPKADVESGSQVVEIQSNGAFLRRHWSAAVIVAAALALFPGFVLLSYIVSPRMPSRVSFTDNAIQVWDAQKHQIWMHVFHQNFGLLALKDIATLDDFAHVVDLKGDGEKEVFVALPFPLVPEHSDSYRFEFDCFSSRGKLLWSYTPEFKLKFGQHELQGPWAVYDIFISMARARPTIWAVLNHHLWGNSIVVELDSETGKPTIRFVNTGVIYKLNELKTSEGTYLVAGGFNNEYERGALAIFNEDRPFAASPQTDGTRHKCLSCPSGAPDYYLVFPRSEINELRGIYEDPIRRIEINEEGIAASKSELKVQDPVRTIYLFRMGSPIQPISLRYDSNYDMMHRTLTSTGQLNHSLENCPERLHPTPVEVWTPSSGWKAIAFLPGKATD